MQYYFAGMKNMCIFVISNFEDYKCKIMINRINLILRAKNITARQFAEEIGIQPSGMSHIMSGRNNPSLDFVTKVIRRYPEIDANWLIMGRGAMYGDAPATDTPMPVVEQPAPVPPVHEATLFEDTEEPAPQPKAADPGYEPSYFAVPPAELEPPQEAAQESPDGEASLVRMLFIYSDNTFKEYFPRR